MEPDEIDYPSFIEHLRSRYGPKWCVAQRLTDRLRDKGHEVALTPKRYELERVEWASRHPATLLVQEMPDSPVKRFIAKAVQSRLF